MELSKEIILNEIDTGWNRPMPVTLITYADGAQDLHRQTGSDFNTAIAKATTILRERGLAVGPVENIGPTGAYMTVTPAPLGNASVD